MNSTLTVDEQLKITNVKSEWERIYPELNKAGESNSKVEIRLNNVKNIDSAGIQLILYLLFLQKEFPDIYRVTSIPGHLLQKLESLGYPRLKSEVL